MIKIVLIALVVLLVGIVIVAATRPDNFRVERSTRVSAPPEKVLAFVNDFHQWSAWSPYERLDPSMQRTYGGQQTGTGAVYEWSGNSKAGQGRMEIIEAASTATVIKLDFVKPFEAHNIARFTARPQGDGTVLSWSMEGPASFMHKLIGLFVNLDRLIGRDFETGLASLKTAAEK